MHILIVDDERELARAIAAILEFYHYTSDVADNGREALQKLEQQSYDGAVLDIMMPELDGLEVLRRVRQQDILVPVLLLTARNETADRIAGLDCGADDYLSKPFAMGELVARVKAMTRRRNQYLPSVLQLGNLTLDRETFSLAVQQAAVQLSHLEFQLMELFMLNPKRRVPMPQLTERLRSFSSQLEEEPVAQLPLYLSYLSKKLEMLQADCRLLRQENGDCMLVPCHD